MKKLFSLILVACIICSCSACSQGRNNSRQSETSAAQTSKTAERTLTPQEKLAETIASICVLHRRHAERQRRNHIGYTDAHRI